jgi:maltoporin
VQPVKWFSAQGVFVYQRTDYGGTGDDRETWMSLGARPVFHFNDRFSIAVEGGMDWVDSGPMNQSDKLWKVTIAPQLSRGGKFFSRPALRAYVTYAKWGDEFRGQVGGPAYTHVTDGLNFGVQVESWW